MKKAISVFLCLALALALLPAAFAAEAGGSFGAYKHVFIIGIDGAGRFVQEADTPNFDRIFKDGAVTYNARAETVTNSAPNWGSILSGVSYIKTGYTNSGTGIATHSSKSGCPTVFAYARQAFPQAELASYVHWNNINFGIIENDIGVNEVNVTDDEKLTDAICDYFNAGNQPTLFFVQLDSIDAVGHSKGSKSEEYFRQINTVDGYVGRIYDAIEASGLMEDGLFIVVADHGHTAAGGHGGFTMRETNVTLAVKGKTVVSGGIPDADVRNRDVAAITLHALGIARPDSFTAKIPRYVFTDVAEEARPFAKDPLDQFLGSLAWIITTFSARF